MGKQWKQCQTLFWEGSKITEDGDCSHEIKRGLLLGRKVMANLDSILKSRDITLPTKVHLVKASSMLVFVNKVLLEQSHTLSLVYCQCCFSGTRRDLQEVVSDLYCQQKFLYLFQILGFICKEIQPVHSKGDQSLMFFGRTDAKAETQVLWPPHVKS